MLVMSKESMVMLWLDIVQSCIGKTSIDERSIAAPEGNIQIDAMIMMISTCIYIVL